MRGGCLVIEEEAELGCDTKLAVFSEIDAIFEVVLKSYDERGAFETKPLFAEKVHPEKTKGLALVLGGTFYIE